MSTTPTKRDSSEFNPDVGKLELCSVRIQVTHHRTNRTGQSQWHQCLEADALEGEPSLDLGKIFRQAVRDLGRDEARAAG